jgi:hypothetical protein
LLVNNRDFGQDWVGVSFGTLRVVLLPEGSIVLTRIVSTLIASLVISGPVKAQQHFSIANSEITAPVGWHQVNKTEDRLVLRSSDQHQQATISVLRLGSDATFEDFRKLCQHRIDAERKELSDGFIQPDEPKPFKEDNIFHLFYSGGEKKTGRVFSAYLSLARRDFLTIYVEGVGVAPQVHLGSFKDFVDNVKRD